MKNAYKTRKNENFEKQNNICFFPMSQGSLNPKIRFLGQKVCPVARGQINRRKKLLVLYKEKIEKCL